MTASSADREILRRLAGEYARIAHSEPVAENRRLLKDLNHLRPERPVVLVFPEGCWPELVNPDDCECREPLLRRWELHFRSMIHIRTQVRDDNAVEPIFEVRHVVADDGFGVDVEYTHGADRGSYTWTPPLEQLPGDISRMHFRRLSVDRDETRRQAALADELFGDLLDVVVSGRMYWWTCGLTTTAIRLIGLERLMLAMYDEPEGLHALMKWLSDEMLHYITWFEQQQLLTVNNAAGYVGSGGVAYTDELPGGDYNCGDPVMLRHLWGFAESQETVGVSPDMFAEFILPYQLPLLEKFGLNCYGCCEPVDQRWEHLKRIPRLRRVSVSPWCDQAKMAENLGKNYVYSRKPNPAHICAGFNLDAARADVRSTLEVAGELPLEIILKDTHTVENDPSRIARWVEMTREEIARVCG